MLKRIERNEIKWEDEIYHDDAYRNYEKEAINFTGSILTVKLLKNNVNFPSRVALLHNQITHEETHFDRRFKENSWVSSLLSRFFPKCWLNEITVCYRDSEINLGVRSFQNRISSYLGFIEVYLNFIGLTMLDSVIMEINQGFGLNINKQNIIKWKLKILSSIPELRKKYQIIQQNLQESSFIAICVKTMNEELVLAHCSQIEKFHIKQRVLILAREFISLGKIKFLKKPEIWIQAICIKAVRDTLPNHQHKLFPHLSKKQWKMVENKRWQLDRLFSK